MSELSPQDLRALVDHMAARGVAELSATQGGVTVEISLRPGAPAATAPIRKPLRAGGPGLFRPHHPAGEASVPCLQAGDFLFALSAPLTSGDELLATDGAEVGYGTPLFQRAAIGGGSCAQST